MTTAPQRKKRKASSYDMPTDEKKAWGARLREARELSGMSLTEAADALGYSQPVQLSLMENGNRAPTLAVIVETAKLYGTTADYLCGLATDSDRDPAVAVQRHVASRIAGEVQRLIAHMTAASVDVVRELMPSSADGQRMAGLVIELNTTLALFKQRNPKFEDMRVGAALDNKVQVAAEAAVRYMAQVERGKRLMSAKTMREAHRAAIGQDSQTSLIPVLDLAASN